MLAACSKRVFIYLNDRQESVKPRHGILGSAAVYTVANIINASIPFLLLPILTRVLSPADYGTIAMFGVVTMVLGAFTGLSVHGIVGIKYFEKDSIDFPRFIATCLAILASSSLFIFLIVGIAHDWLERITKLPFEWLLISVGVSGAQFLIQIRLVVWQSARKPWSYAALQIGQSALNAGLSLWLVLGVGLAWEGRLIGNALAVVLFGLLACWGLWNSGLIKFPASKEYAREALNFGVPLLPHTVGGILIVVADRFIISNVLGVEQTGIYVVALQLGMALGLVADAIVKAYGPWLYEKLKEKSSRSALNVVGATYAVVAIFSLLFFLSWLVLWAMFDMVASVEYSEAKNLLGWILLGNAFKGMYYSVAGFFFFTAKTHALSKITVTLGILQLIATWYFVGVVGIGGAAIIFAISNALLFLVAWKIGAGYVELPWSRIRDAVRSIIQK